MNGFKKLILTTAILAASSSALAMQAMDEASMSSTTGQDGLSININSSQIVDMGVTWIDRDGIQNADFAGSTYTAAGAVTISHLGVDIQNLNIKVDAGSSGTKGQLNVGISTTNDLTIYLNDQAAVPTGAVIGVTDAGGIGTGNSAVAGDVTPILKFASNASLVVTGGIAANLKLGNRSAGDSFMTMDFNAPVNVTLTGLSILDAVGTSANAAPVGTGNDVGIGIGTVQINQLDVHAKVNVVAAGLQINTAGTTIGEIGLERVVLGDLGTNSAIGDVYLTNLSANSVITVTGK